VNAIVGVREFTSENIALIDHMGTSGERTDSITSGTSEMIRHRMSIFDVYFHVSYGRNHIGVKLCVAVE
jgi:hypothetical protein